MTNKEFEEINLELRSRSATKLDGTKPILLMLDGRSFSNFTKRFANPFDDVFIKLMNDTAISLCREIGRAKFAYVQSDEISIYIEPSDPEVSTPWFDGRIQKICSVAASIASSVFTRLYLNHVYENDLVNFKNIFNSKLAISFDCKAWNVPDLESVADWFIYRNKDCVRNSKQQFSQSFFKHKDLMGKNCEEQIKMVLDKFGKDWTALPNKYKNGRLVHKKSIDASNDYGDIYTRTFWEADPIPEGFMVNEKLCKIMNLTEFTLGFNGELLYLQCIK